MISPIKSLPFFCLLGIIAFACSIKGDAVPDDPFRIKFVDQKGKNLLDDSTPNYYPLIQIKVYTFSNRRSYPPDIVGEKSSLGLNVHLYESTMLIELSPTDTDTIKCTQLSYNRKIVDKAWYNDKLVFDRSQASTIPIPRVVIVK